MNSLLDRLLRPRSIAVFGGAWAGNVIEQCRRAGYVGELWPVHPSRDTVAGLHCYASVDALPAAPDASFIGVNRDATIDIVRQLAARQAGGAVCFAAGFSEALHEDASGGEKQQALLEAAGDMPIIGPNCYGFINYLDGVMLWPDQHGGERQQRGVAILTQSSNIAINLTMQRRALPIAYVLTAGNQAQISLAELASAVIEDPRVTALGLHIEGFSDIRAFELLAQQARALGKPIAVLKVGKSAAAQTALLSHTRSLTGSATAAATFLARLGVASVASLTVMLETLKLWHVHGPLSGRDVLSMSCSGGEAALMSDAIKQYALHCPPLDDAQSTELRQVLGSRVALANPLDYHTWIWNDPKAMTAMCRAMLQRPAHIAILLLDFPREDRCTCPDWFVAVDAFKAASVGFKGALAVLATVPENMPEAVARSLIAAGVVPLAGLDDALRAVAASVRDVQLAVVEPVWLPSICGSHSASGTRATITLDEATAKSWLLEQGVCVPKHVVFTQEELAVPVRREAALERVLHSPGFPLVVKGLGVAHKSDVDAIALNICDRTRLIDAIERISCPGGCLIEKQIDDVIAELLVSIVRDPVHGLLLTIAAGGLLTELLTDACHLLLPTSAEAIGMSLDTLRIAPVLQGYRGNQAVDRRQLIHNIMLLQHAALAIGDTLVELEINPLLCTATDCVAVDALMIVNSDSDKSETMT